MKTKTFLLLLFAAALIAGCQAAANRPAAPPAPPPTNIAAEIKTQPTGSLAPTETSPPGATVPTLLTPTIDTSWDWPVTTPEEQGMDSALLSQLLDAVPEQAPALHSLLIIRNGAIVKEKYFFSHTAATPHVVYSITKSVVSALVGIAIQQGSIQSVDQRVLDFFPGRNFGNMNSRKAAMTLKDVLTMTSGLKWVDADPYWRQIRSSPDWLAYMMSQPLVSTPGEQFNYCSGCSHILSGILYATTGQTPQEYADLYLFGPLGIRDEYWETDTQKISVGGWGLKLTSRQMARFGQLYLDRGRWQGQQLIPADWVAESTRPLVPSDSDLGYGYQWWHNASLQGFAALGVDGQMIFIHPATNLVVVFTSGATEHEVEFGLIRKYILPAVQPPD